MPARGSFFVKPLLSIPVAMLFLVLSAAIVVVGTLFYRSNEAGLKTQIQQELASIGDLKRDQIIEWQKERLANAQDIGSSFFARHQIATFVANPADHRLRDTILEWISDPHRFRFCRSVALIDSSGSPLLATDSEDYRNDTFVMSAVRNSMTRSTPVFSDLHEESNSREIRLHIAIPALHSGKRGAIILEIDPKQFLFPLIQKWPMPSRSSETLILRREGDKIVYLNELRHLKNTPLTFTLPADSPELLAAKAARGETGIAEGVDYRGVPVIGALLDIPGTTWHIVAKIDRDEVLVPVKRLVALVMALVLVLITLTAVALGFMQRQFQSRGLRALLLAEREKTALLEAIAEREREFRSLFVNMVEGAAVHALVRDESGKCVNYQILEVNPSFEKQTGIPEKKAKGALATQLYGTPEAPYLATYAAVAETGNPQVFEINFPPLQKYFSISVFSHQRDRFVTVFEDITDRKRTEERIALERERLLVTIRSIGDGVITTDIGGHITLMNRVAEELTGWEVAEAVGKPLSEVFNIINEQTRLKCENPVEKVLMTGGIVGLANHTALIRRDGTECAIADSGAPILDRESRILGVVLVFRDITEKLKADNALQNAQRLESIGMLAGGIAHDFNNLLGGVFGYIDIARERAEEGDPDQAAHFLGKSLAVFDRAKSLTRQLLTFSKGGMPIRRTQYIGKLVRDTVHFVLSGSNVSAAISIPEELYSCDFDENQMAQVIDNITRNACQAMPAGGKIEVTAANIRGKAIPPLLPPVPHIHIAIRDNGIGISPEHLTRIFDPFFSTKQQGSGLGLSISYSIIKKHDGLLEAESILGKGSIFHIYLPASHTETEPGEMEPESIFRGKGRVLVMDDEDFLLEICSDMLRNIGFEVARAHHGDEACTVTREAVQSGKPFAVAILDLTVPGGKGGEECVAALGRIDPAMKVIASSGYADSPVIADPAQFGFHGKLIKPYRKNELAKELARILEEKAEG